MSSGKFTITATASTAGGPLTPATCSVTVAVPAPSLSLTWSPPYGSAYYTVTPTYTDDHAGPVTSYTVDWGDGSPYSSYSGSTTDFTHDYINGGTTYNVEVFALTSVGVVGASTAINVTGSNPLEETGSHDMTFSLSGTSSVVGDSVQATVSGEFDNYCQSSSGSCWYDDPESSSYTLAWGDSTSNTGTLDNTYDADPSDTLSHTYTQDGQDLVFFGASDESEKSQFINITNPAPTVATPTVTVDSGDNAFSLQTTFSNLSSDLSPLAFVDWGNGSGPQPATITNNGNGTGTITANLVNEPPPGTYNVDVILDPMGPTSSGSVGAAFAVTATCQATQPTDTVTVNDDSNSKNTLTVDGGKTGDIYVPEINTGTNAGSAVVDVSSSQTPTITDSAGNAVQIVNGKATLKPAGGNNKASWDYTLSSGQNKITIHVFTLQVGDNNKNPLLNPVVGLVGQNVILNGVLGGDPPAATGWNWTIPGANDNYPYAVKGYGSGASSDPDGSAPTPLAPADLSAQSVNFYWIAPFGVGANRAVSVSMTFGNNKITCSGAEQCSVGAPTFTFSASTLGKTGITLSNPLVRPQTLVVTRVTFGTDTKPGITLSGTITSPVDGQFQVIQTGMGEATAVDGRTKANWLDSTQGKYLNDGVAANTEGHQSASAFYRNPVTIAAGKEAMLVNVIDAPHFDLGSPDLDKYVFKAGNFFETMKIDDSFNDYLMYRPSGGIWVALSTLSWAWSFNTSAAFITDANGRGLQFSLSNPVGPEKNINGTGTYRDPEWSGTPGALGQVSWTKK